MPEGDTIFRTARTLERALVGQAITRFRTSERHLERQGLCGLYVPKVESRGKNLLIHFSNGRVLYSHMRMTGSWHVYRLGERWRRPEHQANLALENPRYVAVCFNAPVVEMLSKFELRNHRLLSRLGPDLLSVEPDFEEMKTRLRTRNDDPIGVALMRQDALCGIGNVYKSETLHLCGENPFRTLRHLEDPRLDGLLAMARRLMLSNLTGYPRITRPGANGSRYWVYGRADEPCFRCQTPILMRRQGDSGRSTYWCSACQP